jgi:hypothetical protein
VNSKDPSLTVFIDQILDFHCRYLGHRILALIYTRLFLNIAQ